MKKTLVIITTILFISACSDRKHNTPPFLRDVDSVVLVCEVADFNNNIRITDRNGIEIFTEIISFDNETIEDNSCNGKIKYFKDSKLLLEVIYCKGGIQYERNGIQYAQRITYRAGRYFDEACYDLQKNKLNK